MLSIDHLKNLKLSQNKKYYNFCILLLIIFYLSMVIRNAWICDDAFITFRTVDNFINGYGLRWNTIERVQSYTHPLWMFCLSLVYFITREICYSAIFCSIFASLAAVYFLCVHISSKKINTLISLSVLSLSKAFVDYSTSGLENALTHLLLALFFVVYFGYEAHKRPVLLSFIASLGFLNRPDVILIYIPPLVYILFKGKLNISKLLLVLSAFSPIIIWEVFSLFYYGAFLPNTAYAKLGRGIPSHELTRQGFYYLLNSLRWDPVTLLIIAVIILHTIFKRNKPDFYVACGMLLYIVYIVRVGGDFMSGRFLTAPLFCAVVLLTRIKIRYRECLFVLICIILLSVSSPFSPLRCSETLAGIRIVDGKAKVVAKDGIVDERGFYYQYTGLLSSKRNSYNDLFLAFKQKTRQVFNENKTTLYIASGGIGIPSFFSGPMAHYIDKMGINEPLLARLPCVNTRKWRVGHIRSVTPKGYIHSVLGKNKVFDSDLREYLRILRYVIRGDLLDWRRIKENFNFNTGKYDYLLENFCYKNTYIYDYEDVNRVFENTAWDFPENIFLNKYGVGINASGNISDSFTVALSGGHKYKILFYMKKKQIAKQTLDLRNKPYGFVCAVSVKIKNRFDFIRFLPTHSGKHSFGWFILNSKPPFQKTSRHAKAEG